MDISLNNWEYAEHIEALTEIAAIKSVQDHWIDKAKTDIESLSDDAFISTATEKGVERREKLLGITPEEGEDLESRRQRIASAWRDTLPYTLYDLGSRIRRLCPDGGCRVHADPTVPSVTAELSRENGGKQGAVAALMEEMVPLHVQIIVNVTWNTYGNMMRITHGDMSAKTHREIREEELGE